MPVEVPALLAFNRGRISKLGLARTDLQRSAWSAETQCNWMPRSLGSMMLRPGLGYLGATDGNNQAKHIPFVFSTDDTALIELTNTKMRVYVSDSVITRASVTASVSNGTFDSDLANWTDADETGATSSWATGGYMSLVGTGFAAAIRRQQVTVNEASTAHALRIVVERGPVTLRVGSSAGDDDYIEEAALGTGIHSLAFTPTGDFHIQLSATGQAASLVDSVAVESSGAVEITTPWTTAVLSKIRTEQSADVVYVACDGFQTRKIERRSNNSWSLVLYEPNDGPYRVLNVGSTRLTPSALNGDITLTASQALFRSGHVGALFSIDSTGQQVEATLTDEDQFSDEIRVTGVDNSRIFQITITGTWTATITLQRSVDEPGAWVDVTSYTTNQSSVSFDDSLDNQIIYYRIGIKSGDYTSGTASVNLTYSGGSRTGVVRITAVTNSTSASAAVLKQLGGTDASSDWSEGLWSSFRGFPTSVALFDGRLWLPGRERIVGSVSDAFESHDPETEGDSGPINRTIGRGPVDVITWILPMLRLIFGTEGAEWSARSSSLDEPLTPTAFTLRDFSTQGSAEIAAAKVDSRAIYVQRGGTRVHSVEWDVNRGSIGDYTSIDLTALIPEIGEPAVSGIAVQRQPDTRVHCWRSDGTVGVLILDPTENVLAWIDVTTDGEVEDIAVLPGTIEDDVYYTVKRTINGATKRYLEKWALESEAEGDTLNKQADSFITFTNAPASATVTGLDHLEAESVVVWADGKCLRDSNGDIATFTVSSGSITLTNAGSSYSASSGVVGLTYDADYLSNKLAYAAALGTPLNQLKRVAGIGFVMQNTHHKGVRFGPDASNLDDLPSVEDGAEVAVDTIHSQYDKVVMPFPGGWDPDARIYLKAQAPRPATILAATLPMRTNERA